MRAVLEKTVTHYDIRMIRLILEALLNWMGKRRRSPDIERDLEIQTREDKLGFCEKRYWIHYAYKEIIEEVPTWILDGGWSDSFSNQITERFQELKKRRNPFLVPQLSSHCKVIEEVPTGMHHAYKEMDTKIIEEMPSWILDGGWVNSFSIQIPERIQELKKALYAVPQLSSHPKPGCLGD